MSKSKNDIDFFGGKARIKYHNARNGIDAELRFINPETSKPFTYGEVLSVLTTHQKTYPVYHYTIEEHKKAIIADANGEWDKVFVKSIRGKTKEDAEKKLRKTLMPQHEFLAKILFRPQWGIAVQSGTLTVNQFVYYIGIDDLFPDMSDAVKSALKGKVLPCVGDIPLCRFDDAVHDRCIKSIKKQLLHLGVQRTVSQQTKTAYTALFDAIKSYGAGVNGHVSYLSEQLILSKKQNRGLINSMAPSHLSTDQRENLFKVLETQKELHELFWVALIYSGMAPGEIASTAFGAVREVELESGECLLIIQTSKIMHKKSKAHSTVSAENDLYPAAKFRKVVLYPWAVGIMKEHVSHLLESGLSDLSDVKMSYDACGKSLNLSELEARIEDILQKADIKDPLIHRTDKNGDVRSEKYNIKRILTQDAQYLAKEYCKLNDIQLHTMFGLPFTTTEESHYIGTRTFEYAVSIYHHLRCFSLPTSPQPENYAERHIIENSTDDALEINITSDYAIHSAWEEIE